MANDMITLSSAVRTLQGILKSLVDARQSPMLNIAIGTVISAKDNTKSRKLKIRVFPYDTDIEEKDICNGLATLTTAFVDNSG